MQDNRKYQQQSIDKGWLHMATLLDKEMPQAKGHRRFGWWLFAAGIALILSVWGYDALMDAKVQATPKVPESQIEEPGFAETQLDQVDVNNIAQETLVENAPAPVVAAPVQRVVIPEQITSEVESKIVSGAASSDSREIAREIVNVHRTIPGNLQAVEQMPNAHNTVSGNSRVIEQMPNAISLGINLTAEIEHAPITPETEVINPEMSPVLREEFLISMVQMPVVAEFERGLRTLPLEVAHATKKRGFGLEGFVATHMNSDGNPFYGIETGLSTVLRSHKRFRIHAGASYGFYNKDGLSVFGLSKDLDTEALAGSQNNPIDPYAGIEFDVQDVYSNSLPFESAKILTEKFQYIHVPLQIEYRLTPRFSALAGVKVSALIGAPARYRLNDERFSSSQTFALPDSRSFLYNYGILRKIDIAPVIGVSYGLGQRFSIDLSYTHGLVHYINSSDSGINPDVSGSRKDFHRSASVGVRYRIL